MAEESDVASTKRSRNYTTSSHLLRLVLGALLQLEKHIIPCSKPRQGFGQRLRSLRFKTQDKNRQSEQNRHYNRRKDRFESKESDVITAAYGTGTHFTDPYLTCLGYLGTTLDGRLTRDMGLYGLDVDKFLRATLATASGKSLTVENDSNALPWFVISHATPNIGNVKFVLIETYSISEAWERHIYYSPASLAAVVATIAALHLSPEVSINLRSPNS